MSSKKTSKAPCILNALLCKTAGCAGIIKQLYSCIFPKLPALCSTSYSDSLASRTLRWSSLPVSQRGTCQLKACLIITNSYFTQTIKCLLYNYMLRTEIRVVLSKCHSHRCHSQDSQKHLCSTDILIIWSPLNSITDNQISSGPPAWFLFCFSHNILCFHGRISVFISIFLNHVLLFCSLPTGIPSGWFYFAFWPAPKSRCAAVTAPITTSHLKTACVWAYGERGGRMLRFLYKVGTLLLQVPQK